MQGMTEFQAKVLARVFIWAWENNIDVKLDSYVYSFSRPEERQPRLAFSKNDKHRPILFRDLSYLTDQMKYEWQRISIELCVRPLNLEDL